MRKSNQEIIKFFIFSILVIDFKYMQGTLQCIGLFILFLLNLSLKPCFLAKHTIPKFCESFNESHFLAKITPCFTTGFMVLNKFIEIYTLIKKNLNFKCEFKESSDDQNK